MMAARLGYARAFCKVGQLGSYFECLVIIIINPRMRREGEMIRLHSLKLVVLSLLTVLGTVDKQLSSHLTDFVPTKRPSQTSVKQTPSYPPVLNGKYQNQMKNTCLCSLHCIASFEGSYFFMKICKIQPQDYLFLVVFISFHISRYHFSQIFRTLFNII